MNLNKIYESDIEETALEWFADLGYTVLHGPDIAPDTPDAERSSYKEVILEQRLRDAVAHLNPEIPTDAQEEAIRKVFHPDSLVLVQNNRAFHQMLVDGIEVEYRQIDGTTRSGQVRLIDFDTPEDNDWLAVNQFTVVETSDRRPDIVLFINGLPLAVIELKNPTDEKATVLTAFRQTQTYKQEIPTLFTYNEAIVISDGFEARIGSLTADTDFCVISNTSSFLKKPRVGRLQKKSLVITNSTQSKRQLIPLSKPRVRKENNNVALSGTHKVRAKA